MLGRFGEDRVDETKWTIKAFSSPELVAIEPRVFELLKYLMAVRYVDTTIACIQ